MPRDQIVIHATAAAISSPLLHACAQALLAPTRRFFTFEVRPCNGLSYLRLLPALTASGGGSLALPVPLAQRVSRQVPHVLSRALSQPLPIGRVHVLRQCQSIHCDGE
eukprot:6196855-Pleurochrysis_carterae.AAC.1